MQLNESLSPPAVGKIKVPANAQGSSVRRRELKRVAILLIVVTILEVVVFGGYFSGATIPPWDFFGSYNTGAYTWWQNGSFFNPQAWTPNSLAGYPTALSLQDGSWYLPIGLAALFGPFTLHASAIVAALHVALGSVGTYALTRSLRMPFKVALFAAVAGFFAVGYFSNAQHLDIVRGYALVPWILLVLSPRWPWRRVWALPLATFILWQTAVGIYPGMLFSTVYVGVVWVAYSQYKDRPAIRNYLFPLALSAIGAVLLCAPKLIPYFVLSGDNAGAFPDESKFDFSVIATLAFGYGHLQGPNDLSMNTLFVPATVLVLCCFANFRDRVSSSALVIAAPAVVLGMPFLPWFQAVQTLPGLAFSRFGMSDLKAYLLIAAVLLAASGLHNLSRNLVRPARWFWVRIGVAAGIAVVLFSIRKTGDFTRGDWLPGLALVVLVLVVVVVWHLRREMLTKTLLISSMIALTAISGCVWAFGTTITWSHPRVEAEVSTYGSTVDELLASRPPSSVETQRPARIGLPAGFNSVILFNSSWNGSYYAGRDALGGNVNIKSSETVQRMTAALLEPSSGEAVVEFLTAPGLVATGDVTPVSLAACATTGDCGPASAVPIRYSPGDLSYQITNPVATVAVLNEAFYPGWGVTACGDAGCKVLDVESNTEGLIEVTLPSGEFELRAVYETPGLSTGWLIFGAGLFVAATGSLVQYLRGRRARTQRSAS